MPASDGGQKKKEDKEKVRGGIEAVFRTHVIDLHDNIVTMTMMMESMAMINDDGINGGILQLLCIEKRPEPSQSRNPPVSMMSNDEQ